MQVRMLRNKFGDGGTLYASGGTYTVADDLGLRFIGEGAAVDENRPSFNPSVDLNGKTPALSTLVAKDGNRTAGWQGPEICAHRNNGMVQPENSMAAIRYSYGLGVRSLELDLQLLKDGQVAVCHDLTRARTLTNYPLGTAAGATTNGTALPVGTTVIPLAAAGTGTIVVGDHIKLAGDNAYYTITVGDSDVSNGGSITIEAPGLLVAVPAAATAITVSDDVAGCTAAEWKTYKHASLANRAPGTLVEAPPLLCEVLDWAADKDVNFNVEPKGADANIQLRCYRACMAQIRARSYPFSRLTWNSFTASLMTAFKADGFTNAFFNPATYTLADVQSAIAAGYGGVSLPWGQWDQSKSAACLAAGVKRWGYTANTRKARDAVAPFVDYIVTDDAAHLREMANLTTDPFRARAYYPGMLENFSSQPATESANRGRWDAIGWGFDKNAAWQGCGMHFACIPGVNGGIDPNAAQGHIRQAFVHLDRNGDDTKFHNIGFGMRDDGQWRDSVVYRDKAGVVAIRGNNITIWQMTASASVQLATGTAGTALTLGTQYVYDLQWTYNPVTDLTDIIVSVYEANGTTLVRTLSAQAVGLYGGYWHIGCTNCAVSFVPDTLAVSRT